MRAEDLIPASDAPARVYRAVRPDRVEVALLAAPEERQLALRLLDLPSMIAVGTRQLSVAPLATWRLELTRQHVRFYHEHRVLDAETEGPAPCAAPLEPLRRSGVAGRPADPHRRGPDRM